MFGIEQKFDDSLVSFFFFDFLKCISISFPCLKFARFPFRLKFRLNINKQKFFDDSLVFLFSKNELIVLLFLKFVLLFDLVWNFDKTLNKKSTIRCFYFFNKFKTELSFYFSSLRYFVRFVWNFVKCWTKSLLIYYYWVIIRPPRIFIEIERLWKLKSSKLWVNLIK